MSRDEISNRFDANDVWPNKGPTSELPVRVRTAAGQQKRVLQLAKVLSATLGTDFFQSMVRHLATALHVDCVYVGELAGAQAERMKTVAASKQGLWESFEQILTGSAAGQAIADGWFACSKEATRVFPLDAALESNGAEGYVGIRLSDAAGQPIGALAALSRSNFTDVQMVKSVLEVFAPRAAAELERKRNEESHRENEQRYQAFISANPDAMWRVEFEHPISLSLSEEDQIEGLYRFGYLAECNEALAQLSGVPREKLMGCRFGEIIPRTDAEAQKALRSAIRAGFRESAVEIERRDDSGRPLYLLRTQFGIVEGGRLRRIWGTTRNITVLRQIELLSPVFDGMFLDVMEGIDLPTVMLDSEGTMTFCNESFLRIAQRMRTELFTLKWLEGVVPFADAEKWKAAFQSHNSSPKERFVGTILQPDGMRRIVLWDTICLRNRNNKPDNLAAIGRDLTL